MIYIRDATGSVIKSINISDLDNADTRCPLIFEVSTRCDMGHEHTNESYSLMVWGQRLTNPYTEDATNNVESTAAISTEKRGR
jgi:hypothetical protein